jgi:hypothetical protein
MIFFFDKNGVPIDVVTNRIFQNSNKANTIFFVYPVENQASIGAMFVNVAFTLPNGENKPQRVMKPLVLTSNTGLNGVIDLDGNKFFIWEYDLKSDVTSYAGTVTCQFFVTVSGELITTASSTFLVEQGVPIIEPIETDSYQELLDYFANVLVPSLGKTDLNLENGTGDYSVIQKTAEGEENEATAEGTYAGGKKSKSTAKRAFTHGNTVENNGNNAASFGQTYTNDGNVALTQMIGGYNGGSGAVIVGQNIYNKKNQTANVFSDEGGAASAMVGAYLYNIGSHAQILGYFLKNRRPLKTVLGKANKDKMTNIFEIGAGKEITTVASDNSSFTYNGYTYTVNYDENNKIVSISFPPNAPSYPKTIDYRDEQGHTDFRVETEGGVEVCLALVNGVLIVYEPYNIFEIDEKGNVITKGNIDGKKLTATHFELLGSMVGKTGTFTNGFSATKSLAKIQLVDDGIEVQGKGKFNGNLSGHKGTFSDGFYAKKQLAEFELMDDGARVQGVLSVSNQPSRPNDVVRLQDLPTGGGKTYYKHSIKFVNNDMLVMVMIEIINSSNTAYTLGTLSGNYFDAGAKPTTGIYDKMGSRTTCVFNMPTSNSITIQGVNSEGSSLVSINAHYSDISNWGFTDTVTEL